MPEAEFGFGWRFSVGMEGNAALKGKRFWKKGTIDYY
jgi:hypothetical protein